MKKRVRGLGLKPQCWHNVPLIIAREDRIMLNFTHHHQLAIETSISLHYVLWMSFCLLRMFPPCTEFQFLFYKLFYKLFAIILWCFGTRHCPLNSDKDDEDLKFCWNSYSVFPCYCTWMVNSHAIWIGAFDEPCMHVEVRINHWRSIKSLRYFLTSTLSTFCFCARTSGFTPDKPLLLGRL